MTFQALYEKAERALRTAMENGNDNFHLETAENIPLFGMQGGVPVPSAILQPHILLENIEDGICLLEAADSIRIIYASPGFYDMLGLSPDTFRLPCDLKDVGIHSDYEADYERAIRERVSTSGAAEHVHRIRDTRGNLLWRHVRFSRIPCPGSRYPVLIEISRNITSSMETRRQLQESVERFQLAFGQSHSMLWEVELSSRTFRTFNGNSSGRPDRTLSRFPEALLEDGLVHPDSARSFGRFALDLLDGKAADTGNFIMKNREGGGYSWFSLSYRQVCDSDHNPVKAVGVQERLPSISGIYSFGSPRRPIPEILRHHLLARLHVNLTADTIEELWQDGTDQTARAKGFSYSDVFERKKVPLFHQADSRELRERFGRDSLLRQFEKGEYWDTLEYDRIDSGGNICRVTGTFNLLRTPQSDDIHLYSCFYDTQQRREWEFLAENGVQRDPVSGLCIGQAVRDIAERLLCSGGAPSPALSLIRMSGGFFRSSEPDADELRSRRFVMIGLSFALGTDCLIGQHSEDSVLVFYPDASSQYDIKKRTEDAYAYVRTVMQELHESQNDLKSTIGELETVNEELQAANEELLTANEELQSSNEELQSVNEELYTVNTEYQQKLDELTMLTNDLSNFLSSTMIGILFVDSNLNIRKFTEYVGREFQLMEHDVGRSLQIFAHSFPDEDIISDANEVLKNLVPIDREVTAMNGRFYTLRIAPYRTTENNIRSLVITIIDSLGVKTQQDG